MSTCPALSLAWRRIVDGGRLSAEQVKHLGRSSHAIAVVGTKVFMFGGEHEPRVPVDDVLLSVDTTQPDASWTPVTLDPSSAKPSARVAPGLVSVSSSSLWLFGGRQGIDMGEGALDDLWRFDLDTLKWSCVQESTEKAGGPTKRSFHQMVSVGEDVFVFGGCGSSGRKADLWRYSPSTNHWTQLPDPENLKGRGGAAVCAAGNKVLVTGGFAGEETNDMRVFDLGSSTWEDWKEHSASLRRRSVFGVGLLGNATLVAFGGEVDPSDKGHEGAGMFAGDTLTFNLNDKEAGWTTAQDVQGEAPCPRGWYAHGWSPELGFVVSGGLVPSNDRMADLYVLHNASA